MDPSRKCNEVISERLHAHITLHCAQCAFGAESEQASETLQRQYGFRLAQETSFSVVWRSILAPNFSHSEHNEMPRKP